MRFLLEIVLAAALIAMAWNKSFKDWLSESHVTIPAKVQTAKTSPPPATATPPKSFTGHIFYTDEQGKSYWLDVQGKRHYQP